MKEKIAMNKEDVSANLDILEINVINVMLDSTLKEKACLKNAKVNIFIQNKT